MAEKKDAPVFVCGFPRSGTTLLYHMLLSSGDFAYYRSETWVFDLIVPRFGDLRRRRDRERLMDVWLKSRNFELSGLDAEAVKADVLANCHNGGDFLELTMGAMARQQRVRRWAECTPTHVLYLDEIQRVLPDALFVHIIRDGRDAALSYAKQGWVKPFPWPSTDGMLVAALYWEWLVRRGRECGRRVAPNYLEVAYEDLIARPRETLATIGAFIDHDLDYDRILDVGVGSVSRPNTSFGESGGESFNPVERWRRALSPEDLARLDGLIGPLLEELGYPVTTRPDPAARRAARLDELRALYLPFFGLKHWVKSRTPLSRYLVNIDLLKTA